MRHSARFDTANPSWEFNEGKERPYDTPLTEAGKVQAYEVAAEKYKNKVRKTRENCRNSIPATP